ncbi:hypothetical protein EZV62_006110 [Acer yangbiense]|uniref:Uncharacterized protein n=1 Tax=Acer yangbiense TaxID=1000413 RepID=A0A5C7IPL5_9ROSI|nr:hypothetical protein EZV62_006110 [Acer yangbiense]
MTKDDVRILESERRHIEQIRELELEELQIDEVDDLQDSSDDHRDVTYIDAPFFLLKAQEPSSLLSTQHRLREKNVEDKKVMDISLKDLSKILEELAKARDWEKYTTVLGIYSLPCYTLSVVADICGIDLADAATKKTVKNAIKYPLNKKFS